MQWVRIGATIMPLPDVAVGAIRSLQEIGKLGSEAREATAASAELNQSAAQARARLSKIANPSRHPGPVNRRLHKVRTFERAAAEQTQAVARANGRIRLVTVRDMRVVSFAASQPP